MPDKTSYSFTSDFVGRVNNISLAPSSSNSLAPLYEAITNSIQSIEEKFGRDNIAKGEISIEVIRSGDELNIPVEFIVKDNGIGFTQQNMKSFRTSDSRYKIEKGGKGVGRFLWLKVFEKIHIESTHSDDSLESVSFDFVLDESNQIRNLEIGSPGKQTGTTVHLGPFRPEYAAHCPRKAKTIRNKIIGHFISYFVNMHAPRIVFFDTNTADDLLDTFSEVVSSATK